MYSSGFLFDSWSHFGKVVEIMKHFASDGSQCLSIYEKLLGYLDHYDQAPFAEFKANFDPQKNVIPHSQ